LLFVKERRVRVRDDGLRDGREVTDKKRRGRVRDNEAGMKRDDGWTRRARDGEPRNGREMMNG